MRIALMHYHMRPGGVSTVIRDQYDALSAEHRCIVLSGELPEEGHAEEWPGSVRVVPELGYSADRSTRPDPGRMADAVVDAMRSEWGRVADILHVHNPTLDKNHGLLRCLRLLAGRGIRIFAQVHDFAEDGRPGVIYPPQEDYPRDCHYGVINSRDREALLSSGLSAEGVHLMFNRVRSPAGAPFPGPPPGRRILYPVRGIRRKNLGEALLVGTLLGAEVTVSLPPRDPADLQRFKGWTVFAETHGLPARFGAGLAEPLATLLSRAHATLTTSVNEGFGFAFLEPWPAGREVLGRRVPHVCRDFEAAGMRFPSLYSSLPVPTGLFDSRSLEHRWSRAVSHALRRFGRRVDARVMAKAWSERTDGASFDFSFLDEEAQREVLTRVLADKAARKSVEDGLPMLASLRSALLRPDAALVESNAEIVRRRYGQEEYARLLGTIYRQVLEVNVRHSIDRERLLDCFLRPGELRMIEGR
ncbi:MAG TPA: glycosyltransferase family 1 protein [Rectinemataceae bacterium]|nr:glycosyltransferase family 1 protein [Rectinemataceae bacterium]